MRGLTEINLSGRGLQSRTAVCPKPDKENSLLVHKTTLWYRIRIWMTGFSGLFDFGSQPRWHA